MYVLKIQGASAPLAPTSGRPCLRAIMHKSANPSRQCAEDSRMWATRKSVDCREEEAEET